MLPFSSVSVWDIQLRRHDSLIPRFFASAATGFSPQTGQLNGTLTELKWVGCRHRDILPGDNGHLRPCVRTTGGSSVRTFCRR
jgi:hypothetical protein